MILGLKGKIGLSVVIVSLVVLFFIVFGNLVIPQPFSQTSLTNRVREGSSVADLQQIAEPTRYFNPTNLNSDTDQTQNDNLTRQLASRIGQMIAERNPTGPQTSNNKTTIAVPSIENSVEDIVAEASKKFDVSYFRPEIKIGNLKTLPDGADNEEYYLDSLQIILKKYFTGLNIDFNEENLIENLKQLIPKYNEAVDQLYRLPVPLAIVPLHQKEISLVIGQKRVFEAIANQQDDPVQALLAIQFFKTIQEEFAKVKTEFSKHLGS